MEEFLGALILLVLFILFAWYWLRSFIEMMLLSDDDFPGRYDKVLWVAVFLVMFLLAPLAFSWWKGAYLQVRRSQRHEPPGAREG